MSLQVNRRNFLRFTAAGAVGVASSGVTLQGISDLNAAIANEQLRVPGGPESWAPGVCTMCPGGCGLRVRRIGQRAVKIQGNPQHPLSRGGLCPKALAGLQELYHPDRLRKPLRNAGSRDNPKWKETSWDEALAAVAERLRKLRDGGAARTVVVVDSRRSGLQTRLLQRFLSTYGSPNYVTMPSGLDATEAAVRAQQGITAPVAYDLANSRYVLSFGVNLLEGWGAPVHTMRAFARWRDTISGRRTKLVQIEPRFSITAGRADEWIALRPGTEAALALGIAYVLISERLYDADFVREHTFGFEDWRDAEGNSHTGFRSLVSAEYRLDDVAGVTGVSADTILRLAREASQNRPAIALGDGNTSVLPGNLHASMAVHSLNALLGSIDVPGGVMAQGALPGSTDEQHAGGVLPDSFPFHATAAQLPQAIFSRQPYPVNLLLINGIDPVFSLPNGDTFARALREVPLVVSFSPFLNDTAALADFVLPTTTGLEAWQDAGSPPTVANAVVSISPPVVRPRKEVRPVGEVVLALARQTGGPVASALPFSSYEEYLRTQVKELFAAQTGAVFGSNLEDTWNRLMERSGWWAPSYSTADELWEQIQQQGGWWQPASSFGDWGHVFRTPSGRFEFYSQALLPVARQQARGGIVDEHACLPHQAPVANATSNFPLLLTAIEVLPLSGGEGAHLPYLQQIAGEHLFANWDSWLEIHPETARRFGIADGDEVWVESRRGRAKVRARLYEGTRPGMVHLPLGYGHQSGSAWACRGANPMRLLEDQLDRLTGLPPGGGTYVKIYRA